VGIIRVSPLRDLLVQTIPSTDAAFRKQVERILRGGALDKPEALQVRLRRLFPRAVVRRRDISGEPTAWYVYRDGGWRPSMTGSWWDEPGLPRVVVSREGWIEEANATAQGLLGIGPGDIGTRHFTDFVVPGTLEDSMAMFGIVDEGHDLTATVVLQSTAGDVLAIDLYARREGDTLIGLFRLADDVELPKAPTEVMGPRLVECVPATDVAFRGYVDLALSRMPEPTPDGLMIRLHRLYPHARVEADGDRWMVRRDPAGAEESTESWWADPVMARVRYDAQALILEANEAAQTLLGRSLVGHHWQEFVTPGSTEQVSAMLAILAEVGRAESRFRMPRADGSLLEFDSYTEVDGEGFTTVMRPRG
jgi:PAS domain-containing protein